MPIPQVIPIPTKKPIDPWVVGKRAGWKVIDASTLTVNNSPMPKASYSAKYFHGFASDLCSSMPPGVWKHRSAPKDCAQAVGNDIEHAIAGLIYDPRQEGNVCAGFGLPQ